MNDKLNKRSYRKTDWGKVKRQSRTVLVIMLVFILVIFSFSYYVVTNQNKIRETVAKDPEIASAKVISISSGKGVHFATYEFIIKGNRTTGSTFNEYGGVVGDQICVRYSVQNPSINLYCEETEMQSLSVDVIKFTLQISGIMILFYVLALIWLIITKNKQFLIENTSRIKNYR